MVLSCDQCGRDVEYAPGSDQLYCRHCGAARTLTPEDRRKVYDYACALKKLRDFDPLSLDEAASLLLSVPDFPDAEQKAGECRSAAKALRERLYRMVREKTENAGDTSTEWLGILVELKNRTLDGYRDTEDLRRKAEARIGECLAAEREAEKANIRRVGKKTVLRRCLLIVMPLLAAAVFGLLFARDATGKLWSDYEKAVRFQENGRYEEALAAFSLLGDHADSRERAEACREAIREKEYRTACALRDSGQYEKAADAFDAMGGYRDSAELAEACRADMREETYREAGRLLGEGDRAGAFRRYASLGDYRDAETILARDDLQAARTEEARRIYGSVFFGRYPQTAAGDDETPVEWTVLDIRDGEVLLVSRYGLECMPYNDRWTNVTWKDSSMRAFLNGEFLDRAFAPDERDAVVAKIVPNGAGQGVPGYDSDGGPDTEDRVFLLSYAEAWMYYRTDADRQCRVTAYAKAKGAETNTETGCGWWWLRSPGSYGLYQADVFSNGTCSVSRVISPKNVVRPALWLNLEKAGL